jgi:hypothetical protein
MEQDNTTLRAVLPTRRLKVDPAMDLFDFLDTVEEKLKTVSPLILAFAIETYRLMQRGDVPNTPEDVLTIYNITSRVNMVSPVMDFSTSMNDPLVLVFPTWNRVFRTSRLLTNPLKWMQAVGNTRARLDESNLLTRAMVELLDVHQRNFDRTIHKHGCSKVIPFLDNRLGKSLFVDKYVSECPKYFQSCPKTPLFQESIKNARTICL